MTVFLAKNPLIKHHIKILIFGVSLAALSFAIFFWVYFSLRQITHTNHILLAENDQISTKIDKVAKTTNDLRGLQVEDAKIAHDLGYPTIRVYKYKINDPAK